MTFFVIRFADGRFYSRQAGSVIRAENAELYAKEKQAKADIRTHGLKQYGATIIRVVIARGE